MTKSNFKEVANSLEPIDDALFRLMAEDMEFCEEVLQVILQDKELKIISAIPQKTITNLQGRSVIVDVQCRRCDGTIINIEVQKADDDDHQRRVRYLGSVTTANITETGTKFLEVPDVCIVFISKFDLFHSNHSMYHVDRVIRETGERVENGFEEIYVNAAVKDGTEVSELMEIFVNSAAYDFEKFPKTSGRKNFYKNTEEGHIEMNEKLQSLYEQAMAEGRAEGENKMAALMSMLITNKRFSDIEKASTDSLYREKLYKEFNL